MEMETRNFGCRVIFHDKNSLFYAQMHIAPTTFQWKSKDQILEYRYVFLELNLQGGYFDPFQFLNTDSQADDNKVDLVFRDVREVGSTNKVSFGASVSASEKTKLGTSVGGSREKKETTQEGSEVGAKLKDLKFRLERQDEQTPKWKIYQSNPTALSISPQKAIRIAMLADKPFDGLLTMTGNLSVSEDGYVLQKCLPDGFVMKPIHMLQYRLWNKMIADALNQPKAIEVTGLEG